jgi:hypothetical protein
MALYGSTRAVFAAFCDVLARLRAITLPKQLKLAYLLDHIRSAPAEIGSHKAFPKVASMSIYLGKITANAGCHGFCGLVGLCIRQGDIEFRQHRHIFAPAKREAGKGRDGTQQEGGP